MSTTTESKFGYQLIPLDQLVESKTNPRKIFRGVEELAESLKAPTGLIEPIVVRPLGGKMEIIAGARRFRAAKLAKLTELPSIVREMSDDDVCKAQLIENNQREDVTPMEQARSYQNMIERGHDLKALAEEIGRPLEYVAKRMQLVKLCKAGQKLLEDGTISLAHALLIARQQPKDQEELIKNHVRHRWNDTIISVKDLRKAIADSFQCDLHSAAFPKDDKDLVPAAGSCKTCPKRTGFNQALFDDAESKDICTDRACFESKKSAFVELQIKAAPKAVKLSEEWYSKDKGIFTSDSWEEVSPKEARKLDGKVKTGVIIDGNRAGQIIQVKIEKPESSSGRSNADYDAQRKQRERACKRESEIRRAIFDAIMAAITSVPPKNGADVLRIVAKNFFDRAGGLYQTAIMKRREITEPKRNQDWQWKRKKMAELIDAMKPGELTGILVETALVSHLSANSNWSDSLKTPQDLIDCAEIFGVDHAAIRDELKAKHREQDKARKAKGKNKAATAAK